MRSEAFAFACLLSAAAIRSEPETFFADDGLESGAYLAPSLRFNSVNEQFGVWAGGRLGLFRDDILAVGVEGYGLISKTEADRPFGDRLQAGVAGLYLETLFSSHRKVHSALALLVGAGSAVSGRLEEVSSDDASDNSFLVVEPEFGLEYNVSPRLRFAPGLSYRWISGEVQPLDSKWQLSEFSLNFRLKFGEFKRRPRNAW